MKPLPLNPQDKARESFERIGRKDAILLHHGEAVRLREKATTCHPAAGGHTNSSDRYNEMADFHDAVAKLLEEMPTRSA